MAAPQMILIVDDEPDMCWALEHLLHEQGLPTRTALSAGEALRLIARQRFAHILLDAKLPDMDGLELARQILRRAPDTRIIMLSGYFYRDDVTIQEAIARGVIKGFISKPFLRAEVLEAVQAAEKFYPDTEMPMEPQL